MLRSKIIHFLNRVEAHIREQLSHELVIYALVSGVLVVLFWKGVWDVAEVLALQNGVFAFLFSGWFLIVWTTVGLLLTGVFISFFVGDRVILSGLKHEKSIEEKTEAELKAEDLALKNTLEKIDRIATDLDDIKHAISLSKKG
ncbi:MAG: hypothetical protein KGH93_02875 [Patescibacteria group bacterium]|nr:hypothetical protein [Patescibacteria group bacterium]MDE1946114.1 hypothetical protein [Patescibacteria group bacterium]